jgi:hypothetical protein
MKRFAGMLAIALAAAAQSQTPSPVEPAAQTSAQEPSSSAAPQAGGDAASAADVVQAASYVKAAAGDFTNCRRPSACYAYFDSFGVAIPFADGSIVPFAHVQRLSATSRDCIRKAKALAEEGNHSLAVQWAMAARIENRPIRDWLGNHPDAVLAALRQVPVL